MKAIVLLGFIALLMLSFGTSEASADDRVCQDSSCVRALPGFSCPPSKLWDQDNSKRLAVCVDCRGAQPSPEQRVLACPPPRTGSIVEIRNYFCQANAWRPGHWQVISDDCICPPPRIWNPDLQACGQRTRPPFNVYSTGLRWSNGAEPYWNTFINRLNSAIDADWYSEPPPTNFVRQGVDYLAAMIELSNSQCPVEPVTFGDVTVRCEIYWEDIVSTPSQRGPFFVVSLWLSRN